MTLLPGVSIGGTMNATRWRQETGQTMPETTMRLLAWMARAQGVTTLDVEETCEEIRVGLCELLDGRSCVVFARSNPDSFSLMAASEGFQSLLDGPSPRTFPAADLLRVLTNEPFFLASAGAGLQVYIGKICDELREGVNAEFTSLPSGAVPPDAPEDVSPATLLGTSLRGAENIVSDAEATDNAAMPSLLVPLRSQTKNGRDASDDICGLAMLWISTPDGEMPGDLKPVLYAATRQAGAWLATALRFDRLSTSYRKLGDVFALISDVKAPKRAGHSQAVAYYARLIAREMQLSEDEAERVEFAGLLHAIGKAAVPDFILTKEEPLTDDELQTVRNSIAAGAEWLKGVDGLQEVTLMIKHQGEHWDGTGYPDGLSGEAIPLGARILAVASRFSAMTRPRVQRRPFPVGGALETLARDSGTQLDPNVLSAFMNGMGRTL
jgi:HD-GYP domain-containing protein (c-di-GMP phosphodiesterase class II)